MVNLLANKVIFLGASERRVVMDIRKRSRNMGWIIISSLLMLALGVAQVEASEMDYPNKMITLINPYAPGGGIDFAYRPILDIMPDYLGQKLVVAHKPGATGSIGSA